MAWLDIKDAEYGRSGGGASLLKRDIYNEMDKLKKLCNDEVINNVYPVIKRNWQGADAEAYLKSLDNGINKIKQTIDKQREILVAAVDQDAKDFEAFQNKNANSFK